MNLLRTIAIALFIGIMSSPLVACGNDSGNERVDELERQVADLEKEITQMKQTPPPVLSKEPSPSQDFINDKDDLDNSGNNSVPITPHASEQNPNSNSISSSPVPAADFNRIDHSNPQLYLTLYPSMGTSTTIEELAAQVDQSDPLETLTAIERWSKSNLEYDSSYAYEWHNVDEMIETGKYGSCADNALIFGTLARACGIPTVWVKTMDYDWIREFQQLGSSVSSWRGHVFLEVFIDNQWMLFDASAMKLYEKYSTESHFFPDDRYAYDKGDDPYELVLSLQWELWKQQTKEYFDGFDLSTLPGFGYGRDISSFSVYVSAESPVYQWVTARCNDLGYKVAKSFNAYYFEKFMPDFAGKYLIITCVGDEITVPNEYQTEYLPVPFDEIQSLMNSHEYGILTKDLADKTHVILLYGKNQQTIQVAINELVL